jgi:hypothetical protein
MKKVTEYGCWKQIGTCREMEKKMGRRREIVRRVQK